MQYFMCSRRIVLMRRLFQKTLKYVKSSPELINEYKHHLLLQDNCPVFFSIQFVISHTFLCIDLIHQLPQITENLPTSFCTQMNRFIELVDGPPYPFWWWFKMVCRWQWMTLNEITHYSKNGRNGYFICDSLFDHNSRTKVQVSFHR